MVEDQYSIQLTEIELSDKGNMMKKRKYLTIMASQSVFGISWNKNEIKKES